MLYLGVDVSLKTLEVANATGQWLQRFPNTPQGQLQLLAWLAELSDAPCQLVVEPTSVYHHALMDGLTRQGIPYALINPAQTAAFARVQRQRAKTDAGDARLLAQLGESQQLPPSNPPDPVQEELRTLRRHQEWLEHQRQAVRNRQHTAQASPRTPHEVLDSLERTIAQLGEEIQQTAAAIAALLERHQSWQAQVALLRSVVGIGYKSAVLLLSEMPLVARCGPAKAWVAYAGVNPEPRQSGESGHSRLCRQGSAVVRAALYMPAVTAMRRNPAIHALNERLKERGKTGMERVMAAMHKLLRQCFGVLKSGQPFNPTLHEVTLPT